MNSEKQRPGQTRLRVLILSAVSALALFAVATFVMIQPDEKKVELQSLASPPKEVSSSSSETLPSIQPVNPGETSSSQKATSVTAPRPKPSQNAGSSGASATAKPEKPKPTSCPLTRNENPKLWDACRAGYVAPKIVFAGLVSCEPADDTNTNWRLTYQFKLEGGNFKKVEWSNRNGQTTVLIRGYPLEGVNDMYPLIAFVDVAILPMNGLSGLIDLFEFKQNIDVPIGRFCK